MTSYGAGIVVLLLLLPGVLALADREQVAWSTVKRFAVAHYVEAIVVGAVIVVLGSLGLGLWRVFPVGIELLDQLPEVRDDQVAARDVVTALAAALAAFGILGAILVGAIRVGINERTAHTAEANLITGLINTAVEGLSAEKRISRIGRLITSQELQVDDEANSPKVTKIEWLDEGIAVSEDLGKEGTWQTYEWTGPNIEVRIGAIYTLERIAREQSVRAYSRDENALRICLRELQIT